MPDTSLLQDLNKMKATLARRAKTKPSEDMSFLIQLIAHLDFIIDHLKDNEAQISGPWCECTHTFYEHSEHQLSVGVDCPVGCQVDGCECMKWRKQKKHNPKRRTQ